MEYSQTNSFICFGFLSQQYLSTFGSNSFSKLILSVRELSGTLSLGLISKKSKSSPPTLQSLPTSSSALTLLLIYTEAMMCIGSIRRDSGPSVERPCSCWSLLSGLSSRLPAPIYSGSWQLTILLILG